MAKKSSKGAAKKVAKKGKASAMKMAAKSAGKVTAKMPKGKGLKNLKPAKKGGGDTGAY